MLMYITERRFRQWRPNRPARAYTPSLLGYDDDVLDESNPSTWAYHIRVKREKEECEYTEAKAQEICERVSSGEFLINICKDEDLPTVRRCCQWMKEHPDFNELYRDAINDRLSIFEDEVITIPDEASKDFDEILQKDGTTRDVLDPTKISAAKLRTEVRFRHLKACRPQKWGEQTTIISKNGDELGDMTTEEVEKKIAELDDKERGAKEAA
jgi:hypothetical protein